MRTPPPRLICLILVVSWLAACMPGPGPTDPDGPIVRTPEPHAASQSPPRLAALGDVAVLPAPQCHACADATCSRSAATDVCLVQCSSSGVRRWDLGLLDNHGCDPAAQNFCEANGLGRVTDSCWGGYS